MSESTTPSPSSATPSDASQPPDRNQLSLGDLEARPLVPSRPGAAEPGAGSTDGEGAMGEPDAPADGQETVADAEPTPPPPPPEPTAAELAARAVGELFARAREESDRGEMVRAIASYREVIALDPSHIRARNNLALLLEKRGDLEGALGELQKALETEPDSVSVLCNRAAILSARLRYEQAEQDLRRAWRLDENDPEVLTNLGILLCKRARWREAIEPLRQATERKPDHAAAYYYLGEAYNHVDLLAPALSAYEAAANLQPGNFRAFKGVGIVLDRMGRPQEAAIAYKRSREAQHR